MVQGLEIGCIETLSLDSAVKKKRIGNHLSRILMSELPMVFHPSRASGSSLHSIHSFIAYFCLLFHICGFHRQKHPRFGSCFSCCYLFSPLPSRSFNIGSCFLRESSPTLTPPHTFVRCAFHICLSTSTFIHTARIP